MRRRQALPRRRLHHRRAHHRAEGCVDRGYYRLHGPSPHYGPSGQRKGGRGLRREHPRDQRLPALLTDAVNRWRYSGKEEQAAALNPALPLIGYGARMYDPTIARWMSVDPLAEHSKRIGDENAPG